MRNQYKMWMNEWTKRDHQGFEGKCPQKWPIRLDCSHKMKWKFILFYENLLFGFISFLFFETFLFLHLLWFFFFLIISRNCFEFKITGFTSKSMNSVNIRIRWNIHRKCRPLNPRWISSSLVLIYSVHIPQGQSKQ